MAYALNVPLATIVNSMSECAPITDLSVGSNSEVEGLTKFANEACNEVGVREAHYLLPRGMPADLPTELREYLARPIVYSRGVYSNTSPGQITAGLMSVSTFPSYFPHLDRIRGAFGFRATLVFRVEVQATPFHAGRLRLVWNPEYQAVLPNPIMYDPTLYLTTMSQMPGVELNINESTSLVMRVPFVSSNDYWWYNSTTTGPRVNDFPVGLWSLWAMHPVSTPAGATNPNYSIWTSLEDVELVSAASPDADLVFITPSVGTFATMSMVAGAYPDAVSAARAARLSASGMPLVPTPPPVSRSVDTGLLTPQAGDPNLRETRSPMTPISTVLSAASRVATLAMNIPLISSYAGPTAWALRVASNVASAFGWSKPLVTTAVTRVVPTSNNYQYNCDGHDVSWNMGLFSDNHIAPLPGFAGSDVDEMALSYVTSIPAITSTTVFSTTNAVSDVLYISSLNPMAAWYAPNANLLPNANVVPTPITSFLPSPLFFVANCFRFWRGDLTFRFKVSKTMFHSGRLLISSHYSYSQGDATLPTPNYSKPFNFSSVVWDLKDSSEIEFTVPYQHLRPFARMNDVLGSLCLTVEQPLLAPTTVRPSVFITVEVFSRNMTFAFPSNPPYLPSPLRPTTVTPQAGATENSYTNGEDVESFKQLATRQGYDSITAGSATRAATVLYYRAPVYDNPTTPTTVNYSAGTFVNYILSAYAYARGSSRFSYEPVQKSQHFTVSFGPDYSPNTAYRPVIAEKNEPVRFTTPFYHPQNRLRISTVLGMNVGAYVRSFPAASTNPVIGYASAADDFQCGYFISAPPLDRLFTLTNNVDTALNNALNQAWVS